MIGATSVNGGPHPLAHYRTEFAIFDRTVYLNSCSLGALSRRSRARVGECLDLWEQMGAPAWYEIWWKALADLRAGYAGVLGARADEIALHPSVSSALASVGGALDYRRRPRVVTTSLDFPTVAYQWLARAPEVELVVVPSPDAIGVPVEAIERAVDDRTALVATSHVFFTSGAIQDIAAVTAIARRRGALTLVDGYQAAGQIPVDVKTLRADFYCGGGLKWLLGGTGVAFLYADADTTGSLKPGVTGWFAHADQFAFDPEHLTFHPDARRFEMGTPPILPVYAQLGGLDLLREIGVPAIRHVTQQLTEDLVQGAIDRGLHPKVAPRAAERTAIVMLPSTDPKRDVARLAAAGFATDARPGHVRVSPFFYNVPDDHRALLEYLAHGK